MYVCTCVCMYVRMYMCMRMFVTAYHTHTKEVLILSYVGLLIRLLLPACCRVSFLP